MLSFLIYFEFKLTENFLLSSYLYKFGNVIAIILFMAHIIIRPLMVFIGIEKIGPIDMCATYTVRNVYFDALPFIIVGLGLHKRKYNAPNIINSDFLVFAFISAIVSVIEGMILKEIIPKMDSVLYIGTVISVVMLFKYSICHTNIVNGKLIKGLVYFGEYCSMFVYFIHPLVGQILIFFGFINSSFAFPLMVLIVTVLLSLMIRICVVFLSYISKYFFASSVN